MYANSLIFMASVAAAALIPAEMGRPVPAVQAVPEPADHGAHQGHGCVVCGCVTAGCCTCAVPATTTPCKTSTSVAVETWAPKTWTPETTVVVVPCETSTVEVVPCETVASVKPAVSTPCDHAVNTTVPAWTPPAETPCHNSTPAWAPPAEHSKPPAVVTGAANQVVLSGAAMAVMAAANIVLL